MDYLHVQGMGELRELNKKLKDPLVLMVQEHMDSKMKFSSYPARENVVVAPLLACNEYQVTLGPSLSTANCTSRSEFATRAIRVLSELNSKVRIHMPTIKSEKPAREQPKLTTYFLTSTPHVPNEEGN